MPMFSKKTHKLSLDYDRKNARAQTPPRDLLLVGLEIDEAVVHIWITRGELQELHDAGVKIYQKDGTLHVTKADLR